MNSSNPSQTQPNPIGESEPAGGAKQRIKTTARETVEQVRNAASSTMARAKEESGRIAEDKRQEAADRLGNYSSAIHDSAKSLEEKDPNIAWFTHRAADRLQGVADYVRGRDLRDLRNDAADLARRHPAAFFGGLFVAGLVVGNLLKASSVTAGNRLADGNGESDDSSVEEKYGVTGEPVRQPGTYGGAESAPRTSGIQNQVIT